ncbi:hypothetical protein KKH82_04030 [Patescibacteria group bacterium]|nr:hypothetical protein [Patescibacteria group bacterium]
MGNIYDIPKVKFKNKNMKTTSLIIGIIVTLFTIATSCSTSETKDENPISQNFARAEIPNPLPTEEKLAMIDSSVLEFEVRKDGEIRSSCGHCCLYCNRKGLSYLILPYHVFPYDSTQTYKVMLKNFKGERIEVPSFRCLSYNPGHDVLVYVIPQLDGIPTVSERYQIAKEAYAGDSVVLWTPFNVRNITRKTGTISSNTEVKMDIFVGEPGDSGGLIIGKNGIIGMAYHVDSTGTYVQFIPTNVFEQQYQYLITDEKMSL